MCGLGYVSKLTTQKCKNQICTVISQKCQTTSLHGSTLNHIRAEPPELMVSAAMADAWKWNRIINLMSEYDHKSRCGLYFLTKKQHVFQIL